MIGKFAPFTHLRPTTTPEMLDRAYAVTFRFALLMFGAAFVAGSEHLLVYVLDFARHSSDPAAAVSVLSAILIGEYVTAIALLALFQGIIFPLRPLASKALARTALRKLPGYFLTHLLYVFAVVLIGTVAWGLITMRIAPGASKISTGVALFTLLTGVYVLIRLSLAPIACLVEDCSPHKAFGRSWALTARRMRAGSHPGSDHPVMRWISVAVLPVLMVCVLAMFFLVYDYLNRVASASSGSGGNGYGLHMFLFIASLLAAPFYWAGLMALYLEYRMRHEALDFYLRIRELRRNDGVIDPYL